MKNLKLILTSRHAHVDTALETVTASRREVDKKPLRGLSGIDGRLLTAYSAFSLFVFTLTQILRPTLQLERDPQIVASRFALNIIYLRLSHFRLLSLLLAEDLEGPKPHRGLERL